MLKGIVWRSHITGLLTLARAVEKDDKTIVRIIGDSSGIYPISKIFYVKDFSKFKYMYTISAKPHKFNFMYWLKVRGNLKDAVGLLGAELINENPNLKEIDENLSIIIKLIEKDLDNKFRPKRKNDYCHMSKDIEGLFDFIDQIRHKAVICPKEAGGKLNVFMNVVLERVDDLLLYREAINKSLLY